jgi:predicted CoA-binding protein
MDVLLPDGVTMGPDPIVEILKRYRTIAVVGLSSNPSRPSHGVTQYMQSAGYRTIPVNPNEREVLGEKCYTCLEDVLETIEIVDIFRRPETIPAIVDSAIKVQAKVLWMQLGIDHPPAAQKARSAGLIVVTNACILIEHKLRRRNPM